MNRMNWKRLTALLLTVLLLLNATGCMALYTVSEIADPDAMLFRGGKVAASAGTGIRIAADNMPVPDTAGLRKSVPFDSLVFERPDNAKLRAAIAALGARLDSGDTDGSSMVAEFDAILAMVDDSYSEASLAYLYFAEDVTDHTYENASNEINAELLDIDVDLTELAIRLYEDPVTGPVMDEMYSPSFKEQTYAGRNLNSREIQPLLAEEQTLSTSYDTLYATFTIEDNGVAYGYDDLYAIEDDREFERLTDLYYTEFNRKAGELFRSLAGIRSRIANSLGYDSYADYGYQCYFRDYSPEDARVLHAAVKQHLVPLYSEKVLSQYMRGDGARIDAMTVDKGAFYTKLRGILEQWVPDAKTALDHMLAYGYYSDAPRANRMSGAFTSYLSKAHSPFLFAPWTGTVTDAVTLTHELGHFTRMYLIPTRAWSGAQSLDLDETDSQGLELLLARCYDDLFVTNAEILEQDELLSAMYAVISGCLEDEFQQEVYAHPEMSVAEMNALYARLAAEYGLADLYGYTGTEWTTVPHTFQSPMYYISYAVSMLSALELWSTARTDPAAAFETYRNLLRRPWDAKLRETCASFGLGDPLDENTVRTVAEALKDAF
ncbi:MAG: M3 family metallopeptidase [Clostridia bacterium]|nr:M3 family metallopeptidase [Clostridia bacterium]